jgi:hypothetical protein
MGAISLTTSRRVIMGGMLRECSEPGCVTLTLGGRCIAHEPGVVAEMPRGVPYLLPASMSEEAWMPVADPRFIRA